MRIEIFFSLALLTIFIPLTTQTKMIKLSSIPKKSEPTTRLPERMHTKHEALNKQLHDYMNDITEYAVTDATNYEKELGAFLEQNKQRFETDWDAITDAFSTSLLSNAQNQVYTGVINYLIFYNELAKYENVVVKFGADWCGPCKLLDPILEQLAQDLEGKVTFIEINADQFSVPGIAIKNLPTLVLYKDGQAVDKQIGLPLDQEQIQETIINLQEQNPNMTQEELGKQLEIFMRYTVKKEIEKLIRETFELDE